VASVAHEICDREWEAPEHVATHARLMTPDWPPFWRLPNLRQGVRHGRCQRFAQHRPLVLVPLDRVAQLLAGGDIETELHRARRRVRRARAPRILARSVLISLSTVDHGVDFARPASTASTRRPIS
jgi:hypothetical protein